jgi:hypothetical protein
MLTLGQRVENERVFAKLIGEPINPNAIGLPIELATIANYDTAEPGEHVYRLSNVDKTADVVLVADAAGLITPVKRTPIGDTLLTFVDVNSKLEYVQIGEVLNSPDQTALARRKSAITRSMDLREIKIVLDALITPSSSYFPANQVDNNEVTVASGQDLYDVFVAMKQKIEDYGDNFPCLVAPNVKSKLDVYDKEQASVFNYNVDIMDKLRSVGIEVTKIFGMVSLADNEVETALLASNKIIMVSENSRIPNAGKPITVVRRKFSAEIAQMMGATVDSVQRALITVNAPVQNDGNRAAFGIYGYSSNIFCITNPYAVGYADVADIM